jgi:hypothetical protein
LDHIASHNLPKNLLGPSHDFLVERMGVIVFWTVPSQSLRAVYMRAEAACTCRQENFM